MTYMYVFLPPVSDSCHCAFCNSVSKEKKREAILFHFQQTPVEIVACPAVCTARQHPATKVRGPLLSFAVIQLFATPGVC